MSNVVLLSVSFREFHLIIFMSQSRHFRLQLIIFCLLLKYFFKGMVRWKNRKHIFEKKLWLKFWAIIFYQFFSTLIFDGLNHQSYHAFFPRHHINYFKNISLGSIDYFKSIANDSDWLATIEWLFTSF